MKVILNKDVQNLGEEGDVREVKAGYARNYLLPNGLVLEFNARNAALIEGRRAKIEQRKTDKKKEAQGLKARLEEQTLVVKMMAGDNGRLFGAVTAATVVEELSKAGIEVERRRIELPEHSIKSTGNYKITVRLYGGQEAVVPLSVVNLKDVDESAAAEFEQGRKAAEEASRARAAAAAAGTEFDEVEVEENPFEDDDEFTEDQE